MLKPDHRLTVASSIVCLALGWWLATSPASPVKPTPEHDRPVLRFLAKVAKMGLWVMLAGERPKTEVNHIAQHDPNALNHAEGW